MEMLTTESKAIFARFSGQWVPHSTACRDIRTSQTVSDSVQTHKGPGSGEDLDSEILNYVYIGNCFMILNKINQVQMGVGVRGGGKERWENKNDLKVYVFCPLPPSTETPTFWSCSPQRTETDRIHQSVVLQSTRLCSCGRVYIEIWHMPFSYTCKRKRNPSRVKSLPGVLALVVQAFRSSTQEAESGRFLWVLILRSAWFTQPVPQHPELQWDPSSKINK